MIIRQSWYALILLGGWHACRALLVCAELGRCWEQGSIKEWVHSQVPDLRFEGEILVVGSYRINAIAGAWIFAVRESLGFRVLRAVLTWSACPPELFKNRVCRTCIGVEVWV